MIKTFYKEFISYCNNQQLEVNDPIKAFELMLESASSISEKLHASICDSSRAPLSKQMIEHLKSKAQEISHLNSMKNISA